MKKAASTSSDLLQASCKDLHTGLHAVKFKYKYEHCLQSKAFNSERNERTGMENWDLCSWRINASVQTPF